MDSRDLGTHHGRGLGALPAPRGLGGAFDPARLRLRKNRGKSGITGKFPGLGNSWGWEIPEGENPEEKGGKKWETKRKNRERKVEELRKLGMGAGKLRNEQGKLGKTGK